MDREQQIAINLFINNNRFIQQLNQENNHVSHRGSIFGHVVILHNRQNVHHVFTMMFVFDNPMYGGREFHRRFRMSQRLFLHVVDVVKKHDNYFN